jgi:hypothetical protein
MNGMPTDFRYFLTQEIGELRVKEMEEIKLSHQLKNWNKLELMDTIAKFEMMVKHYKFKN